MLMQPGDLLTWASPTLDGPAVTERQIFLLLKFGENILCEPNCQELICLVDGKIRSIDRFYCTLYSPGAIDEAFLACEL